MSGIGIGFVGILALLGLLAVRMPIGFALTIVSLAGMALLQKS